MGSLHFTLSDQISDTLKNHGLKWTMHHYCIDRRGPLLSRFEWVALTHAHRSFV